MIPLVGHHDISTHNEVEVYEYDDDECDVGSWCRNVR